MTTNMTVVSQAARMDARTTKYMSDEYKETGKCSGKDKIDKHK